MAELTWSFVERASELFRTKTGMTRDQFDNLTNEMKTRAFTVAYVESVDRVKALQDLLNKAVADGTTLAKFRKSAIDHIDTHPWHLETVFRTNVQSAYGAAHWESAQGMRSLRPYARYSAIMDGRTRPNHARLHGLVYPIDHPFWKIYWPPWDYNCRCGVVTLTQMDIEEAKITPEVTLPDVRPAKDFTSPAAAGLKIDPDKFLGSRGLDAGSHMAAQARLAQETAKIWEPPATVFPEGIKGNEELENLYRKVDVTGKPEYYMQLGQRYLEVNHPELAERLAVFASNASSENPFNLHEDFLDRMFPFPKSGRKWTEGIKAGWVRKTENTNIVEAVSISKEMNDKRREASYFVDRLLHGERELPTLKKFWWDERIFRSYAHPTESSVNLTMNASTATVVHEIGHHVEFSSPNFRAAAREFRDWKAKEADSVKPLTELIPGSGYKPDEVARWDDFSHPYKAKVYKARSVAESPTEVVSMSFEQFYGTSSFFQLYERHRDEFYWFIGLLKSRLWL